MGSAQTGIVQCARVRVQAPDGRTFSHEVTSDDNLIVGSSPNCSLRLESSEIAAMHCLIKLQQGKLSVQDWYTTAGTFLNGERLQQPCGFSPGDEIRVGDYRLTAEFVDGRSSQPPTDRPTADQAEHAPPEASASGADSVETTPPMQVSSLQPDVEETPGGRPSLAEDGPPVETPDFAPGDSPGQSPRVAAHGIDDPVEQELRRLRVRITELELENEELQQSVAWESAHADGAADPFDSEMTDLLKSEIEQLQSEIAQRDARITELTEFADAQPSTVEDEDGPVDTAALVDRLEKLLDELQRSDERAATLEDLLRAADEATRAEQEERRQLAAWVGDIEARMAEREAEWRAGQNALQSKIENLTAERERFSHRLSEMGSRSGGETAAAAELIEDLRSQVADLQEQLDASEQSRKALQEKIDSAEFRSSVEAMEKQVEERIREERLHLSQEHSKIARERAEVARLRAELEQNTTVSDNSLDDATCRVQAFREHLKDIHKEQAEEREARKLTSRLARLWKRLEGN